MRSAHRAPADTHALIGAVLILGASGCAVFKDVPPTFAKLAAPPTEIVPDPEAATIVVAYPGGVYDGGSQAITVLIEDGTPIAQVVPRSYAVARVASGERWFTTLIPEIGAPWCLKSMPGRFEKGKIYTFNVTAPSGDPSEALSLFVGVATATEAASQRDAGESDRTGKVLSKLSFLEVDPTLARRYGETHRAALHACAQSASNPVDAFAAQFAKPMPPGHGRERIEIPPPP